MSARSTVVDPSGPDANLNSRSGPSRRVRILVVDDDEVFRDELSSFLSDERHEVASAPSARKALELLESEEHDVVFTDLKMPRQSGLDLLKEVRRRWPRTYVVVVTGFATVATAVDAMKSGAFEYISKPFRTEQVVEVLKLIAEEQRFADATLPPHDPAALAHALAKSHKVPILVLTNRSGKPNDGVVVRPIDAANPALVLDEVDAFFRDHDRGGVIVGEVDKLLATHRLEDILAVLEQVRLRCEGRGPFALGIDPKHISRDAAAALRGMLTQSQVHGALEAIASPIRRRVLERLAQGPASFSEVMHAAELADSPKLSFHLHRLVDEGLINHSAERYKLTPKGDGAVALVREMARIATGSTADAVLFRDT